MPRSNTILIIEEDATVQFMMRKIARALDINVETATSCSEGLFRLRERPSQFAMIIVNLRLCAAGHDDTVQSIRADQHPEVRGIPIIGVTEEDSVAEVLISQTQGVDERLHKPVTPAELLSLVDRYFTAPLVARG
ncbi:response regulator [Epibacterium ulvae]|uniref:response regulator n=1 Tax=Epibacterium ulvae TaxID=1156985 RepID=UPI001BFC3AC9|nr:response regulator [Epibacterium ulvae]MBT8156097.1 response regulator [Epibacterium ulvae]